MCHGARGPVSGVLSGPRVCACGSRESTSRDLLGTAQENILRYFFFFEAAVNEDQDVLLTAVRYERAEYSGRETRERDPTLTVSALMTPRSPAPRGANAEPDIALC